MVRVGCWSSGAPTPSVAVFYPIWVSVSGPSLRHTVPAAWFLYPGWEKFARYFAGNFTGGKGSFFQGSSGGPLTSRGKRGRLSAFVADTEHRCRTPAHHESLSRTVMERVRALLCWCAEGGGEGGFTPRGPLTLHTLSFENIILFYFFSDFQSVRSGRPASRRRCPMNQPLFWASLVRTSASLAHPLELSSKINFHPETPERRGAVAQAKPISNMHFLPTFIFFFSSRERGDRPRSQAAYPMNEPLSWAWLGGRDPWSLKKKTFWRTFPEDQGTIP